MFAANEAGARVLLWGAALLLFGGVVLAVLSGDWGFGALVFGLGGVLLGLGRVRAAREAGRAERSTGWVLVLGGTAAMVDGLIRILFYT